MEPQTRQILVFLLGPLTWLAIAIAVVIVLRARRGKPQSAARPDGALFHEGFVTGCSHKSAFTRYFFVSRNSIAVTVTAADLIIASYFPFSLIPIGDLDHRAARRLAKGQVTGQSLGRTWVTVAFEVAPGQTREVELLLRDPDGFLAALAS